MIPVLLGAAGLILIGIALLDAFETVVLPRRVSRRVRLTRFFYAMTWRPYALLSLRVRDDGRREAMLSFYGPSCLLLLLAVWAVVLVLGFALLQLAAGSALNGPDEHPDFGTDLYFSGTTFFTLGLGDVVPRSGVSRLLTVWEAGTGFAFLALLIGYLPIVYQMFARRETNVSLLDQRAGSPPSAGELVRRNVEAGDLTNLIQLLHDWELWVADLLESHLSYSVLAYFRSQHENQSWLGALAVILDVSAYVLACGHNAGVAQAGFTFAIARHAVGDLANVFEATPRPPATDRLDAQALQRLLEIATARQLLSQPDPTAVARLSSIRASYEPYLQALSDHLLMALPPWLPEMGAKDNWESTAWDFSSPADLFGPDSPLNR